jgi:hypothetical protein
MDESPMIVSGSRVEKPPLHLIERAATWGPPYRPELLQRPEPSHDLWKTSVHVRGKNIDLGPAYNPRERDLRHHCSHVSVRSPSARTQVLLNA